MDLQTFFQANPKVAIAFSGGVDSAYLLYMAVTCGAEVGAYYLKSAFQPQFEFEDATRIAAELDIGLRVIPADMLTNDQITANPQNRCYFCKRVAFELIGRAAQSDGFPVLLDGTNASDSAQDRPGMRALRELAVRSPLRECGLTKQEIRQLSKQAGLATWNKPAYACLATRIPPGEVITRGKLQATESAEKHLHELGFADFRVRMLGTAARLQVPASQFERALALREQIVAEFKRYYSAVLLDLEARP